MSNLRPESVCIWVTLKTFNIKNLLLHDVGDVLFPLEELKQTKAPDSELRI